MAAMIKRWYRLRRNQMVIFTVLCFGVLYYIAFSGEPHRDLDITKRSSIIEDIERRLQEALKLDKGTGCDIPNLDPYAKEVTQFDKKMPKVVCKGQDWVKCHLSKCRVKDEIRSRVEQIACIYRDILYHSDANYTIGPPTEVTGGDYYILEKSDHVKVSCDATPYDNSLPSKWLGHAIGYRTTVERKPPPAGREETINVLIFGFDSTAKNGFIRRMPKSFDYLVNHLDGIVLEGYNILGDGTPAALFPILTGKNELELPDVRKAMRNNGSLDMFPFLFYRLKEDGYRTAYYEDMPWIGTFQYRFNGFRHQPADHYLRAFYLEESQNGKSWWKGGSRYCVGDTPRYKLMMDITDQFFQLDGKKFGFTFVADITHDEINMISTADDDMINLLMTLKSKRVLDNTLVFVMGDHGPRYAKVRDTLQGKLEERLPLMCILVPPALVKARPEIMEGLKANVQTLTTPHDVHATLLDAMGLPSAGQEYRVPGADLPRAMTLFKPIPRTRSCSEAGIEPHWCACLKWVNVTGSDPMHGKTVAAAVDFINSLTKSVRSLCVERTLLTVEWVMRRAPNQRMLAFVAAKDPDGYVGKFSSESQIQHDDVYQIKFIVGPGKGVYEASLTYKVKEKKFHFDTRDISRVNAYNNEPHCISNTHPHLNMYCYCKEQ